MKNFWELDKELNKKMVEMKCSELEELLKPSTHGYKVLAWMKLSAEEKCEILKKYLGL